MAFKWGDRVKDTTTTTGTGTITVSGTAPTGYQAFGAVFATSDTFYYAIVAQGAADWEVGLGTLASSTTFARTTVLASSNAGAAVSFAAGTKDVWCDVPAAFLTSLAPAGTGTEVQYRNGTSFGAMLGTAWDATARALSIAGSTITTLIPVLDLSQTWNNAAVAFTAFRINVTNTASAAGSLLMDLQFGGVSQLKVDNGGTVTASGAVVCGGVAATGSSGNFYTVGLFSGQLAVRANGSHISGNPTTQIGWGSVSDMAGSSNDAMFTRKGAASIQQGDADAAAPVAQTLNAQSVVAGTSNTAGQDYTFNGSRGTGTGAGGDLVFKTARAGTTGSSQNALAEALRLHSEGAAQLAGGGITVANLPTASAMPGAIIPVTDAVSNASYGTVVGGGSIRTIVISDGTNWKMYATQAGAGTGDMLSTNNLSDVASTLTSRKNLQVPSLGLSVALSTTYAGSC